MDSKILPLMFLFFILACTFTVQQGTVPDDPGIKVIMLGKNTKAK